MTRCEKLALPAFVLALLGAGAPAHAGPKLYEGTLSVHAFGFTDTMYCGLVFCESPPYYTVTFFYAIPIGKYCNTQYTGIGPMGKSRGMGDPYDPCLTTPTLHGGAPLSGSGTLGTATTTTTMKGGMTSVMTIAPPAILFGPENVGELRRTTMGSFSYFPSFPLSLTTATVYNGSGTFFPGGGPGSVSFQPSGTAYKGRVRITPGSNQFGGTLRLLGKMQSYGYARNTRGSISIGYFNWLWSVIGGPRSNSATHSTPVYLTYPLTTGFYTTRFTKATGFPWTTGTVTVTVTYGSASPVMLARRGYDNRDPDGNGTIQLVSPNLTHWTSGVGYTYETNAIGVLRLQFVPEPSSWLLLVAGTGLLGLLSRRRIR